jgi:hypothetical protein
VRDYTNQQWPETPFGAEHRPFGRHQDMLTAFAVDWTFDLLPADPLPVATAAVYLRVRRHGSAYEVSGDTLSIGFRATVVDGPVEVPELLSVVDRALTRARRHAVILAGHSLGGDLDRMMALSTVPLRGAVGVANAWTDRTSKGRGLALMVDTAAEARPTAAELGMVTTPLPVPVPDGPACCAALGRAALGRALAIGLTAAVHAGRYRWEGTFLVADAIDRAAWDVLAAPATVAPADTAK